MADKTVTRSSGWSPERKASSVPGNVPGASPWIASRLRDHRIRSAATSHSQMPSGPASSATRTGSPSRSPVAAGSVTAVGRGVAPMRPSRLSSQRIAPHYTLPPTPDQAGSEGAGKTFPYSKLERTDGYQRSNGESSHTIVSSRWAPVEMRQNGTPISSSSRSR